MSSSSSPPVSNSFFGSGFSLTTDTDFLTTDGGIVKTLGYNFNDLQARVLDYLDRPELADQFPGWVRLFQNKMNRILRTGMQEAVITLVPDPTTNGCVLPNDFASVRAVQYGTGPIWNLEYATPEVIAREWPYASGGIPRLYTIQGTTLFPVPANSVVLTYYRGVQPYLAGVLNDWILLNHFDIYLYGTLCEAESFLKNDDRAQMWQQRASAGLTDLFDFDRNARWAPGREASLEYTP
jgi:hypothetical protein